MNGEKRDVSRIPPRRDPQGGEPPGRGDPDIATLAVRIDELSRRAALEYAPLVEDILCSRSRDVRRIEQTLDGLLDFCGHGPVLTLYRRLCRRFWDLDPTAAARYVQFYRETWDSESPPDRRDPHE